MGLVFHTEGVQPQSCSLLLSSSIGAGGNAAGVERKGLKCYSLLHCLVLEATWAIDTFTFENQSSTTGKTPHL